MLDLVLDAGGLLWLLGLLVRSVHREVLTGLLRDLVFVVKGGFEIYPLMNEVFQLLLVFELFLL